MKPALRRYELVGGWLWLGTYLFLLEPLLIRLGLTDSLALNRAYFLVGFGGTAALFHRFLAEALGAAAREPGRVLRSVLLCFCLYELCQVGLGLLLDAVAPALQTPNDDSLMALARRSFGTVATISVLLAPLIEETLFRGLVFGSLWSRSRPAAYGVTAALFAAGHVLGYGLRGTDLLLNLLLYALPGLILCRCYERGGTIWGPILLHAGINALSMWAAALQ